MKDKAPSGAFFPVFSSLFPIRAAFFNAGSIKTGRTPQARFLVNPPTGWSKYLLEGMNSLPLQDGECPVRFPGRGIVSHGAFGGVRTRDAVG